LEIILDSSVYHWSQLPPCPNIMRWTSLWWMSRSMTKTLFFSASMC